MNPFARIYAFWTGIPPQIREPIKSFAVSAQFGAITAIGTLAGDYFTHPGHAVLDWHAWPGFLAFLASPHAIGAIFLTIGATYRLRQGAKRVATSAPAS